MLVLYSFRKLCRENRRQSRSHHAILVSEVRRKAVLRKLRGVMGIGLTWGISWAVIGAAVGFVMRITVPGSVDQGENELIAGALIGFVGLVSGIGFVILLSFLENL
jgi:hypothetical protein